LHKAAHIQKRSQEENGMSGIRPTQTNLKNPFKAKKKRRSSKLAYSTAYIQKEVGRKMESWVQDPPNANKFNLENLFLIKKKRRSSKVKGCNSRLHTKRGCEGNGMLGPTDANKFNLKNPF
jgi:hypothetical protein